MIEEEFIRRGLPVGKPIQIVAGRGRAIKDYVESEEVDKFVILDDDIFADYDEDLLPFLIKLKFHDGGLMEEHVKEAIDYLGDISDMRYLSLNHLDKPRTF